MVINLNPSVFGSTAEVKKVAACNLHDWEPIDATLWGYLPVSARCKKCGTYLSGASRKKEIQPLQTVSATKLAEDYLGVKANKRSHWYHFKRWLAFNLLILARWLRREKRAKNPR